VTSSRTLLRDVSITAGTASDVLLEDGVVRQLGRIPPSAADQVVEGGGAALLPGLHDHHCHLFATASAARSVPCDVATRAALLAALADAAARTEDGWVRGVGYDDATVGELDRAALDAAVPRTPVRVQHRSGALWVLNSAALTAVGADDADLPGIERDASGRATGRLWRMDAWLRERTVDAAPPDLAALGRRLSSYGITGVTDATPDLTPASARLLAAAHASGALPQRITVLGDAAEADLLVGPRKIVLADHELPGLAELGDMIAVARAASRAVALHCVTRESLLLALAVLREVGTIRGDRIEHAAVAPPEAVHELAALRLTVVTQPSLVATRGDDYLARVEPQDVPHLWRYRSLLDAGIPVGSSSDAPYGDLDPWASVRAAVSRRPPSGQVVGAAERVDAATALAGFLSDPCAPGAPSRCVAVGSPADLVLLDCGHADVLADPRREHVRLTLIAGEIRFHA
jgi:predicted amidohydrolase YtcJ